MKECSFNFLKPKIAVLHFKMFKKLVLFCYFLKCRCNHKRFDVFLKVVAFFVSKLVGFLVKTFFVGGLGFQHVRKDFSFK